MENCLFQRKELCVYELKDSSGYYDNDLVVSWKEFARDKKLICSECGANVRLAAGQIVEPYFAHYDKNKCIYGNSIESEETRKAKRLLYQLLKQSFQKEEIHARYRLENGLYSTLYVKLENSADIAVEYRRQSLTVEQFRLREQYYQRNNIKMIHILPIELDKTQRQLSWYQDLIHKSMNYTLFLNVFKETLLFKKSFEYVSNGKRKIEIISKEYVLKELLLDNAGNFICDYELFYQDRINKLIEQVKQQERELIEAREREAIRYQHYIKALEKKDKEDKLAGIYQKVRELENKKELPDWVRFDVLTTAIACMFEGEGYLVADRYKKLISDLISNLT